MMMVHRGTRFLMVVGCLCLPGVMHGQGFAVNEIGSCAMARGFANTASPCNDASRIYWNPAATSSLDGWSFYGGATWIALKGSFSQDTTLRSYNTTAPTQTVPNFFANYHPAGSKASYGVGVYVPYGLTMQWGDSFPGRFEAQYASIKTVYVQPNLSWQLNPKWSIGGGPIYGHSSVELRQALDLANAVAAAGPPAVTFGQLGIPRRTEFGLADLKGSANGWGLQFGVQGQLTDHWNMGLRYMAPILFKYTGATATFTQVNTGLVVGGTLPGGLAAGTNIDQVLAPQFAGGQLVSQSVSTKIAHPAQIAAGLAYSGFKNWLLDFDYLYTGWKQFGVLPVTFSGTSAATTAPSDTLIEDYNNTSTFRVGAEYTIPTNGWKLRLGAAGAAAAAPPQTVTPLLPDQDRTYGNLGIGIPIMQHWALDAAYSYVWTGGARGRLDPRTNRTVGAGLDNPSIAALLNTGVYKLTANVFSINVKASF